MSCAGSRVPGGALGVVMAVADLGLGQVGVGVCHVEVPRAHPLVWAACSGSHGLASTLSWQPSLLVASPGALWHS